MSTIDNRPTDPLKELGTHFAHARAELTKINQEIVAARQTLNALRSTVIEANKVVEDALARAQRADAAAVAAELKATELIAQATKEAGPFTTMRTDIEGSNRSGAAKIETAHAHFRNVGGNDNGLQHPVPRQSKRQRVGYMTK